MCEGVLLHTFPFRCLLYNLKRVQKAWSHHVCFTGTYCFELSFEDADSTRRTMPAERWASWVLDKKNKTQDKTLRCPNHCQRVQIWATWQIKHKSYCCCTFLHFVFANSSNRSTEKTRGFSRCFDLRLAMFCECNLWSSTPLGWRSENLKLGLNKHYRTPIGFDGDLLTLLPSESIPSQIEDLLIPWFHPLHWFKSHVAHAFKMSIRNLTGKCRKQKHTETVKWSDFQEFDEILSHRLIEVFVSSVCCEVAVSCNGKIEVETTSQQEQEGSPRWSWPVARQSFQRCK